MAPWQLPKASLWSWGLRSPQSREEGVYSIWATVVTTSEPDL